MGAEASTMTCASVRVKGGTLQQRLDRLYDDVEQVVDAVEQVVEDATTSTTGGAAGCNLSSREHEAVAAWFWRLLEQQSRSEVALGPESSGRILEQAGIDPPQVVYEDELMFELLAHVFTDFPETAERAREWLHRVSAGHWLAGARERAYSLPEWLTLFRELQMPRLALEATTVPLDDPLCVRALMQLPAADSGTGAPLLLCACDNDSYLDRLEHTLDAAGAAATAATISTNPKTETLGVRPLGAIVVYRWPSPSSDEAAAAGAEMGIGGAGVGSGKVSAALAAHPGRRADGPGGRRASSSLGMLAHAPLQSGATAIGYCRSGRLLLVGCRSGSVQVYSPTADWARLKLHFAVEAHASPVASLVVWSFAPPSAPPPQDDSSAGGFGGGDGLGGGGGFDDGASPPSRLPLMLTAGSDPDGMDAEYTARHGYHHVFACAPRRRRTLVLHTPLRLASISRLDSFAPPRAATHVRTHARAHSL